ncbi:unnamed protein product [Cylicostephanus goldi]|uniref:Uncharacterized protein n=1 Tax=Cylicostephanus goldi TaxID=71465 RepID=A0A3P7LYY2_CYLGO|nr:unnamed protein product [Cylicostephanus goldi]
MILAKGSQEASADHAMERISEKEFVQKAEEEEREWSERTEDLMTNLSITANEEGSHGILPPTKRLTPEEVELKRKTGKVFFRPIVYNEGELKDTDLNSPPSA